MTTTKYLDHYDRENTPEDWKRIHSTLFPMWKAQGVKPEEIVGVNDHYREPYAEWLKKHA